MGSQLPALTEKLINFLDAKFGSPSHGNPFGTTAREILPGSRLAQLDNQKSDTAVILNVVIRGRKSAEGVRLSRSPCEKPYRTASTMFERDENSTRCRTSADNGDREVSELSAQFPPMLQEARDVGIGGRSRPAPFKNHRIYRL